MTIVPSQRDVVVWMTASMIDALDPFANTDDGLAATWPPGRWTAAIKPVGALDQGPATHCQTDDPALTNLHRRVVDRLERFVSGGAAMAGRTRAVVAVEQPLLRRGVAGALTDTRAFDVVGQGATAAEAETLAARCRPELMVLDMGHGQGGLEAVRRVMAASPTTRIILMTGLEDRDSMESAFAAGVSGYLLRAVEVAELCRAAAAVLEGEAYVSRGLMRRLLSHAEPERTAFSLREEQILQLLSQGLSNKNIAFALSLSEKTAKYYLTTLMRKLHATNRVEVALFAAARNADRGAHPA